ncbi:solute carrier family 35 member F3-like [Daphnia carinata]|uniref:solute carrier family 35 member F3-like n=1 Tax=Daphnia carinata TaxID=120202 RepID=UPI00257A42E8|nr:solute carrier family 35 member F3-like [Daphnia carinata]
MDEEAEQQLTAELANSTPGQQLDGTTTGSSPVNQQQRRSLASLLSIKRETRRPKTPSVVVTDETTHLSELTSIPAGRISLSFKNKNKGLAAASGDNASRGPTTAVNGGTLESIVALEAAETTAATTAPNDVTTSLTVPVDATGTATTGSTGSSPPTPATTPQSSFLRRCCHERVRKSIWGVVIMCSVSAAWVGATHLLKSTFRTVHHVAAVLVVQPTDDSDANHSTVTPTVAATSAITTPIYFDLYHHSFDDSGEHQQEPEKPLGEEYTYSASFFSTWTMTAWTSLFLPLYAICCLFSGRFGPRQLAAELRDSVLAFRDKGFTLGTFIGRCCLFCLLWVVTNWMYMYALSVLDATDVMALFATNVSFVYLLSWVVLHDQFVGLRIVAVILCNTGIALLAYMDGITRSPTLGGVVLAAAASAGSAVYKVSFKRIFGEATYGQVSFFFSLIGLLNIILLWPVVLLLHFTGLEAITWNRVPWIPLAIAGSLSLAANLLGNFGPALTYEVFIHLGLVLAIPVSAVLDVNLNGVVFEGMKLAGTIMIVNGFLLVLLPENWPDYLTRLLRWGRHLNHHPGLPTTAPVDLRTGYISRSHLRSPSGRVR